MSVQNAGMNFVSSPEEPTDNNPGGDIGSERHCKDVLKNQLDPAVDKGACRKLLGHTKASIRRFADVLVAQAGSRWQPFRSLMTLSANGVQMAVTG